MKTFEIKIEANAMVNKNSEFTVEAIDRNDAIQKARSVEAFKTRLVRVFENGIELFFDTDKK